MGHPNFKMPLSRSRHDFSIYVLAVVLGVASGCAQPAIHDLLVTALLVVASTMLLGALRPDHPWRWTAIVALLAPAIELLAFQFLSPKPPRSEIFESLLLFLPGIAGAYGGSVLRRALHNIREEK
jgi:hypothetical protein